MNKPTKKLTLSRENIRTLTKAQLDQIAAGGTSIGFICHTGPSQDACSMGYSCVPSGDKCY